MALDDFRIIETVHQSRRFILYKAERLQDRKQVLIKTQDPGQILDQSLSQSLIQEAGAADQLHHRHIRKGLGCFSEGLSQYLVAEYAPGLALMEFLIQNSENVTFNQGLVWARDLLHALIYASKKDIRHHNLNPYNIIVNAASELKVIGFGKKRDAWKHSEGNFNYPYPMLYVAPEIFKTSNPHPNSEIYSWAVIFYQTLCQELPWRLDSFIGPDEQKMQSFSRGVTMPDTQKVPDGLYSVLLACLRQDPGERVQDYGELLETLQREVADIDWAYHEPAQEAIEPLMPKPEPVKETVDVPTPEPEPEMAAANDEAREEDEEETPWELIAEAAPSSEELETEIKPEVTDFIKEPQIQIHDDRKEPEIQGEPTEPDLQDETIEPEHQDEPARPHLPLEEGKPEHTPKQPAKQLEAAPEEASDTTDTEAKEIPKPTAAPARPPFEKPAARSIPKPVPQSGYYGKEPEPSWETPKDLGKMRKIFITLMILSVIIISYVLIQQLAFRHKPKFKLSDSEEVVDAPDLSLSTLAENIPLETLWVPSDTLIMGSISPEAKDNEFPLLTVKLDGFMITPREITQGQWNMVYPNNPSLYIGPERPVENVSFYDVIEFCNAKSQMDGLTPAYDYHGTDIVCDFEANGYRLPTEAEWEFAAKAGIGKNFKLYSGSDDPDEIGWYSENSSGRSQTVGSKKPNSLAIYDMSGNVYEWVWNWYAPYSYRIGNLYSGPIDGTDKVIRGGSWYHNADRMRTTSREYVKPFVKTGFIGFRVVRSR